MKLEILTSLAVSLGLSAVTLTSAQGIGASPQPSAARTIPSITRQVSEVFNLGEQLRVNGPRYRATFDSAGATFTPALGSLAPQTYPLRLEILDIRRGDKVLWDAAAATAKPSPMVNGRRVTVVRGANLSERFEATPDGVELSWEFRSPLAGAGDLVVRYEVITDLEPQPATDGASYLVAGIGGVTIGAVTGIDATGERCAGSVRSTQDRLELILPDAFLTSASYPMVLDPVVGNAFLVRQGTDDEMCDVAYDDTYNRYLFVWQTVFSGTDSEIHGQLTDTTGGLVGPTNFLIDSPAGATMSMRPRVANVRNTSRFLVVWQEQTSIFGGGTIRFASVNPSTGTIVGTGAVAGSGYDDQPEVANSLSTDNDALVVFRRRNDGIQGVQIDVPASSAPAVTGSIVAISTSGQDHSPTIADGSTARRVVAWVHPGDVLPRPLPDEIRARATTNNLTPQGTEFSVYSSASLDPQNPSVDGDGSRFLIAWDVRESSSAYVRNVYCRQLRWTSDLVAVTGVTAAPSVAANDNDDDSDPAVALIGNNLYGTKYLLAWTDGGDGTTPDSVIGLMTINPDSCVACSPWVTAGGNSAVDFAPAIASRHQAGEDSDECVVAINSADRTPPFDPDVWGIRYEAFGTSGTSANIGGGCGLTGTIYHYGAPAVGNVGFEVRLSGVAGALGGVLIFDRSPPASAPIACGTCSVLVGLGTLPPSSFDGVAGLAAAALPIPCNVLLVGGQLEVQWLTVTVGYSPCGIVPNLSASDRLRITIGQ